jgi:CBS domain-containing protein
MTTAPVFFHRDDEVDQARQLIESHQVSRIIVLDNSERLAGIISLADIVDIADESSSGETLQEIKRP